MCDAPTEVATEAGVLRSVLRVNPEVLTEHGLKSEKKWGIAMDRAILPYNLDIAVRIHGRGFAHYPWA